MAGSPFRARTRLTCWSGLQPEVFALLRKKYFVDEIYEASVIRFNAWWAQVCDWLDYWVWNGAVQLVSLLVVGLAWLDRSAG